MKKTKGKELKVAIWGATGRMGQEVFALIEKDNTIKTVDYKKITPDVWIDFSSPSGFTELLKISKNTPVVSGTTGFGKAELSALSKAAKNSPVFWASNMSIGVAVLKSALQALRGALDFDIAIDEIHHKNKKDSPSGTAITLADEICKLTGKKNIPINSLRAGGVRGVHRVHAFAENEIITFQHEALSRTIFAEGAIRAAKWIVNQKPGVYGMDDLIKGGIKK